MTEILGRFRIVSRMGMPPIPGAFSSPLLEPRQHLAHHFSGEVNVLLIRDQRRPDRYGIR